MDETPPAPPAPGSPPSFSASAVWDGLKAAGLDAVTIPCEVCGKPIRRADVSCAGCSRPVTDQDRALFQVKIEGADHQAHERGRRVRSGARWIGALAILFAISAPIGYMSALGEADAAMAKLAPFADDEELAPIDGKVYTVPELRAEVQRGPQVALGLGVLLAGTMGGLWIWARRAPLPAIACAIAVFVVVQVVGALLEPSSLLSGIIIKIFALIALGKGLTAALAARAAAKPAA